MHVIHYLEFFWRGGLRSLGLMVNLSLCDLGPVTQSLSFSGFPSTEREAAQTCTPLFHQLECPVVGTELGDRF